MERPVIREAKVRVLTDEYDGLFKVDEVYPCWVWEGATYPYYLTDGNEPVILDEDGTIAYAEKHKPHAPNEVEEVQ